LGSFKKLTFLKVLAAIAWADGEITNSELNILKSFYRKFGLNSHQMDELKRYIRAPISHEEQEELFRSLIAELDSAKNKREITDALHVMATADGKIHPEEKLLIEQFEGWMKSTSFGKRSIGKLRNFLTRTIFKNARQPDSELKSLFQRVVEKKIHVKSGGKKIKWPGDSAYRACLLGTLMASIAYTKDGFTVKEKLVIRKRLGEKFDFSSNDLVILCEIACELGSDYDFYETTMEVNRLLTFNDRIKFMECLFEVAVADAIISHQEVEVLRNITKALKIPHKNFIACKVLYKTKIE
tara:strand:- start:280 stop:1170 length:891 start_codon:yes stop_codon:yes gene_type:complete